MDLIRLQCEDGVRLADLAPLARSEQAEREAAARLMEPTINTEAQQRFWGGGATNHERAAEHLRHADMIADALTDLRRRFTATR